MALPETLSPTSEDAQRRAARITPRSVALGLLISCLASAWVTYSRTAANTSAVNITHLPVSIFAIFLCVFIANTLLKIRFDRQGLASRELAVIFAMGLIGAIIPARGLTGVWLGLMAAPHYLATPENGWIDNVQPYLPPYLFPSNDHQQTTFFVRGLAVWRAHSVGGVGRSNFLVGYADSGGICGVFLPGGYSAQAMG